MTALFLGCNRIERPAQLLFLKSKISQYSYRRYSYMPNMARNEQAHSKPSEIFQLSIFGEPVAMSKNVWSQKLIDEIPRYFHEVKIFPEKEDGEVIGVFHGKDAEIMFKGLTPLAAVEDLNDGMMMLKTEQLESLASRIADISKYIANSVKTKED